MAKSRSTPVRGELLDRAFISAMRFRWRYRGHESQGKAIASLRRRCPGFTAIQYANAFQKGTDLYNCAWEVVKNNEAMLARPRPDAARAIPRGVVEHLRKRVPGFKVATYHQAVGWVVYWHYWR
jgi:hypothetical protein